MLLQPRTDLFRTQTRPVVLARHAEQLGVASGRRVAVAVLRGKSRFVGITRRFVGITRRFVGITRRFVG
ncbi:hypothetical protein, partial [Nocardia gipuzkoensis]